MTESTNNVHKPANLFADCKVNDDGSIEGPDGCHWDNKTDYVLHDVLKFCGCGSPEEAAEYALGLLETIDAGNARDKSFRESFASVGEYYFILYMLDHLGLEEHGSTTPGWLSPLGEAVRIFLEAR